MKYTICIQKSLDSRIVIPTPEIIQSRLFIVHIPPIAEGLYLAKRILQIFITCYVQHLTPRIVSIFYNYITIRVNDLADTLWASVRKYVIRHLHA